MMRLLFCAFVVLFTACQPKPQVSPAAFPASPRAHQPMQSGTSNAEFEKRVALLNELMDGKVSKEDVVQAKDDRLKAVLNLLPPNIFNGSAIKDKVRRDILVAEFYFRERRFVESAQMLSKILDQTPNFHRARNLLARCFYFLGNPSRAMQELEFVVMKKPEQPDDFLDALFLMGAIPLETPTASKKEIKKGIKFFETYLKLVSQGEQQKRVKEGLAQLKAREKEQKTGAANALNVVASGNVDALKKQGLQAFAQGDLMLAEKNLKALEASEKSVDAEAATALARVYVQTGRAQEALDRFSKVVKAHSDFMPAWHYKGMAHMMKGDPRGAIESWQYIRDHDAAYAARFGLEGRIAVAKQMLSQRGDP